jgi:hypothetical protein
MQRLTKRERYECEERAGVLLKQGKEPPEVVDQLAFYLMSLGWHLRPAEKRVRELIREQDEQRRVPASTQETLKETLNRR